MSQRELPEHPTSSGPTRSRRSATRSSAAAGTAWPPPTTSRHQQRRGPGAWLVGRRQHGPQHDHHPVELSVGRVGRHLRGLPQAVGRPRGDLGYDVFFAQRGVLNLAHTFKTSATPSGGSRLTGSTAWTPSGSTRSRSRSSARSSTSAIASGIRCWAAATSRGPGSPSTTGSRGATPPCERAGRRPHPELRGHPVHLRRRPGHRGGDDPRPDQRRQGGAVRRRSHVSVGRAGRVPGADPVAPAAGPDLRAARDHPREVVRSNHLHVYVSQAHKGELVMGAGVDSYTGYGQRGSFHIIEHQMAAAGRGVPSLRPRTCCAPGAVSSTSSSMPPR
jgi:hypothetical protein